jgi:HAD superfamily hydrolase (TIGR01509 family)
VKFLKHLNDNNIKVAVASSAPKVNLEFILRRLEIEKYFDALVYEDIIINGKPDPEIYLKAASLIGNEPERCIVIEDALSGIQSGLSAGMKVIGMTTVHTKEQLNHTNLVIDDFEGLTIEKLETLFNGI